LQVTIRADDQGLRGVSFEILFEDSPLLLWVRRENNCLAVVSPVPERPIPIVATQLLRDPQLLTAVLEFSDTDGISRMLPDKGKPPSVC
jgi:hypothetical protein